MIYSVAIIGKPNVGKTTLINKLIGRKVAIVYDEPGVTRDRQYIFLSGRSGFECNLIDTPGVDYEIKNQMQRKMHEQTDFAIKEAHICLFVVDGKGTIDSRDTHIANMLKKSGKQVILLVNKCDNKSAFGDTSEIFKLGFDDAMFISAEHKIGFDEILRKLKNHKAKTTDIFFEKKDEEKRLRIGIVGKPNSGKSTFVNSILGFDRCVVSDISGTTRDSINIDLDVDGNKITIVDTAGIRKKSVIIEELEKKMVFDSFDAVRMSDICVLLIDSVEGIASQDFHILDVILKEGRIPVICFNKIDLITNPDEFIAKNVEFLAEKLHEIYNITVFSLSAKNDTDLHDILRECVVLYNKFTFMNKTSYLNKCLERFKEQAKPCYIRNSEVKFKYMAQIKAKPPYFLISSNFEEDDIKASYLSEFKKFVVDFLKLSGIPIRIKISKTNNPYAKKK